MRVCVHSGKPQIMRAYKLPVILAAVESSQNWMELTVSPDCVRIKCTHQTHAHTAYIYINFGGVLSGTHGHTQAM